MQLYHRIATIFTIHSIKEASIHWRELIILNKINLWYKTLSRLSPLNAMANVDDVHTKPIPAFYCCYLLRSTVRQTSLYIGSTPHPSRRLAQHNGVSRGGARKTANDKRPWEMVLIVEGFMNRTAALQFEYVYSPPSLLLQALNSWVSTIYTT